MSVQANVTPDPLRLMNVKDLERIKLNVGGQKFETSADTLKKYESFFSQLLASDIPQKVDAENYILIDRDGTHFGEILNFMRNNSIDFGVNITAAKAIRAEADFYQLQELIQRCDEFLASPIANLAVYERAVYTDEERKCLIATGKALVFLTIGPLESALYISPPNEAERHKAFTTSMINFMKLRKRFHHFTFILDYVPINDYIRMNFWFDKNLVQTVAFYDSSSVDMQLSEATNIMSTKMLDKLTVNQ